MIIINNITLKFNGKKGKVPMKNKLAHRLLTKRYNLWLNGFLNKLDLVIKWLKRQHNIL